MTTTYRELVKAAALTGTAASLYTAPPSTSAAVHAASVNNPTAGVVTVNVYKVASAGAAGVTNKLVSKSVPPGATAQLPELVNHKLEPGSQIYADGNGCYLNISGVEYVQN
jgi:hypothetical protein